MFSNNQTLRLYHSGKNTHQKKKPKKKKTTHTKINDRLIKIKIKLLLIEK